MAFLFLLVYIFTWISSCLRKILAKFPILFLELESKQNIIGNDTLYLIDSEGLISVSPTFERNWGEVAKLRGQQRKQRKAFGAVYKSNTRKTART